MQKRQETTVLGPREEDPTLRLFPLKSGKTSKTAQNCQGRREVAQETARSNSETGTGGRGQARLIFLSCQNCIKRSKSLLFGKNVTWSERLFPGYEGRGGVTRQHRRRYTLWVTP